MILAKNSNLNWIEVCNIIADTCDPIDSANGQYNAAGHSPLYGFGRVNAGKAVAMAKAMRQ